MSNLALFALGFGVTLITGTALTLLVIGAFLDGRDAEARRRRDERPVTRAGRPVAVAPSVLRTRRPVGAAGADVTYDRGGEAA